MNPTIGELCARYVQEMKPRGSRASLMERLQRESIASVRAPGVARDYILYCRERRNAAGPATVMQDIVALRSVLAYAKPGWGVEATDAPIREAWPILRKGGLIAASARRTRRPSEEETAQIAEYFRARGDAVMADIVEFQADSSRRIGETCRLLWGDVDQATKTVLVRNMKHPTRKGDRRVALPLKSFEIVMRQPTETKLPGERIFKVNPRTVSWKYRCACRALGFADLRLHDSRRGATTKLLEEGRSVPEVMLVTGHVRLDQVLTTYNALRAEDFHRMPRT